MVDRLAKTLKWLLLSTSIIPVVYIQAFFSPFLTTKVLLFRLLVQISLAIFAYLLYAGYKEFNFAILKKKITWLPVILLAIFYLSAIFGLDFYNSFWSDFVRMEGLLTLTHVVIFFYLLIFTFKEKDYLTYIKLLVVSGLIASLYGLGQRAGLSFLEESGLDRAAGTLGNAAFLSSYLVFTSFLSMYLMAKAKKGEKWFWCLNLVVSLLGIFYSGTRGAILALLATLFVYLIYYLFTGEDKKKKTYAGAFLAVIIIGGVFGYTQRDMLSEHGPSVVRRFANIGRNDATTESRLFVWKNTLSYIKQKPLLGYGVENFAQVYDKFHDPTYVVEDWFDRTHNIYLDYAFSSGFIGLLVYLSICTYLLVSLFRLSRYDNEAKILFFMIIAYMTQNFFVFDSISTIIVFYFIFAFVITKKEETPVTEISLPQNVIFKSVYVVMGLASIYAIYPYVLIPALVNHDLYQGYMYQIVDVDRSIKSMDKGLSYNSFAFKDYAYQNYEIFLNQVTSKKVNQEDLTKSYQFVSNLLADSIKKRPYDVRLYTYLISIYEAARQNNFSVEADIDRFENLIKEAIILSPKRQELRYMLSNVYNQKAIDAKTVAEKQKYEDKSIEVLKDYDSQVPETVTTKLIIANILFNMGRKTESGVYFDMALAKYKPKIEDAQKIISYYLRIEKYAETVPYYEYLVSKKQNDYTLLFDLSQAYYAVGNTEKAYQTIQLIQKNSPETLNINPEFVNLLLGSNP